MLRIAGFATCPAYKQAKAAIAGLAAIFPSKFSCEIREFDTRDEFMAWLPTFNTTIGAPQHKTSPIVWFEDGRYLGGRDDTVAWCQTFFSASGVTKAIIPPPNVDQFNPDVSQNFILNYFVALYIYYDYFF